MSVLHVHLRMTESELAGVFVPYQIWLKYDEVVAFGSITLQSKTVWGRYSSVDTKKRYGK